jgi:hypothetical protein
VPVSAAPVALLFFCCSARALCCNCLHCRFEIVGETALMWYM